MSSVEFHEEADFIVRPRPRKASFFTRVIYKLKLAKDEAGAQRVMLVITGICFTLAALLFLNLAGAFQ